MKPRPQLTLVTTWCTHVPMIARLFGRAGLSTLRYVHSLKLAYPKPRLGLYHRSLASDSQARGDVPRETSSVDGKTFVKRVQNGAENFHDLVAYFEEKHVTFHPASLSECFKVMLDLATVKGVEPLDQDAKYMLDRIAMSLPQLSLTAVRACLQQCACCNLQYPPMHTALIATLTHRTPPLPSFHGIIMNLSKLKLLPQENHFVLTLAERMCDDKGLNAEESNFTVAFSRATWALSKVKCLPESVVPNIHEYFESNLAKFNIHSISVILWVLTKHGEIEEGLLAKAAHRAAKLLREDSSIAPQSLSMLCWVLGTLGKYQEDFFQAVSYFVCNRCSRKEPRMFASVAWSCAKVAYYDPELMDCIATYVMGSIEKFTQIDLGNVAYSFGYLNHKSTELLVKLSDHLLSQPGMDSNTQSLGNATWACLIHSIEHRALFERYAMHSARDKELGNQLQLETFVAREAPHLGLSVPSDVHDRAVANFLRIRSHTYSVFHTNVTQAVRKLFGDSTYFTIEAFTKASYILDIEVLLDSEGNAIPIPASLRHQNLQKLTGSAQSKEQSSPSSHSVNSLINGMKVSEQGSPESSNQQLNGVLTNFSSESYSAEDSKTYFLASDWLKNGVVNCARRLAIEADGIYHFASNCRHTLGHTALKHRQLKACGWDVISIPYFEWETLETDDDHVQYLARKIFPAS